jgi:hypothetical protein
MSATKSNELRAKLLNGLDMVVNGDLAPQDGRNVIGMANQLNLIMQTELKKQRLDAELGKKVIEWGDMEVAEKGKKY